ncbi:cytochrome C [Campylobacter jejuni subsp. doylei]|nr:cytochrome C [Campylobacter jejuni subsp. doylei]
MLNGIYLEALNEDGTIDETKMPKNSEYSKMVILGNKILNETIKYAGPQAKDPKKDLREIIFLVQAVMLMAEVCKINQVL